MSSFDSVPQSIAYFVLNYIGFIVFFFHTLGDKELVLDENEVFWLIDKLEIGIINWAFSSKKAKRPKSRRSKGLDCTTFVNMWV